MAQKERSGSWPSWPKNGSPEKVYNEVYLPARKRTRAWLTRCMRQLRVRSHFRFSVDTIPPTDPLAIATLLRQPVNDFMDLPAWARGCSWPSYKAFLGKMRPTSVMDIAIALALSQRRAVESGNTARYLSLATSSRRNPVDPLIEPITRSTRGCLIFTEQLMEAGRLVAGFSIEQVRRFRLALQGQDETRRLIWRSEFIDGARRRGVTRRRAIKIFDACSAAGEQGVWSRCHSLEYANLNYRVAYMKAHFPSMS